MNALEDYSTNCPYCGEHLNILIDCSVPTQQYIEDCQVCCRPIEFHVQVDGDGDISLSVRDENE